MERKGLPEGRGRQIFSGHLVYRVLGLLSNSSGVGTSAFALYQ